MSTVKSEVDPAQLARVLQYAADRERARQELVRSRQYFQALIEQTFDLITVVDADGTILYQNPGIKRVLGLLPEEGIPSTVRTSIRSGRRRCRSSSRRSRGTCCCSGFASCSRRRPPADLRFKVFRARTIAGS
ncbi:MAG: PAS domain S-box protein [Acidobacteria bacterium]|nr:PAS domain S-box protein [Acidobacteriota bacterium]